MSKRPLLRPEVVLRTLRNPHSDNQAEQQGEQYHQAQKRTDGQHYHDHAYDSDRGRDQLREALLQGGTDVIHVVDDAAEDFTVRARVKKLQRQAREFLIHFFAQPVHRALRHSRHHILLDIYEDGADDIQAEQNQQNRRNIVEINAGPWYAPELRYKDVEELVGRVTPSRRTGHGDNAD